MIKEVIVVEGRDDESAVKRAAEVETIATHGYGIAKKTFDLIDQAYEKNGIIIFTDPDHAGEGIRKRLAGRYPDAKHAYLPRQEAEKDGDIGIENASPESIRDALSRVRCTHINHEPLFTTADLLAYGLMGSDGASAARDAIGKILGIGYGNTKVFLSRLNHYGITREELDKAWTSYIHQVQSGK